MNIADKFNNFGKLDKWVYLRSLKSSNSNIRENHRTEVMVVSAVTNLIKILMDHSDWLYSI